MLETRNIETYSNMLETRNIETFSNMTLAILLVLSDFNRSELQGDRVVTPPLVFVAKLCYFIDRNELP